jgi:hypothetical protein
MDSYVAGTRWLLLECSRRSLLRVSNAVRFALAFLIYFRAISTDRARSHSARHGSKLRRAAGGRCPLKSPYRPSGAGHLCGVRFLHHPREVDLAKSVSSKSRGNARMAEQQHPVFHSSRAEVGWVVTQGDEVISRHRRQKEAEAAATEAGRKAERNGTIARVMLHRRDGSVRKQRGYGPRRGRKVEQQAPDIDDEVARALDAAAAEWAEAFELSIVSETRQIRPDNDDRPDTIRLNGDSFAFPEAIGECREIGAVPPIGASFNDPKMHARISAALAERFPQFTWRVAQWALRDDTFTLIPMLGSVKAGGLLKPPDPYLLEQITEFLNETFAPNRKTH